jgi:hypothetical protein
VVPSRTGRELTEAAKKALLEKVRSDLRSEYDDKIKDTSLRVLAPKAFKRQGENGGFWTAPFLVTIRDRETRWQAEDLLRKSKVFPGFHWPREMVDSVKAYRKVVEDMGFSDQSHYVRIRPEQRDGSWRIRADAMEKESISKFLPVASFRLPLLDDSLHTGNNDWLKPVWVLRFVRDSEQQDDSEQITAEDIIMNL